MEDVRSTHPGPIFVERSTLTLIIIHEILKGPHSDPVYKTRVPATYLYGLGDEDLTDLWTLKSTNVLFPGGLLSCSPFHHVPAKGFLPSGADLGGMPEILGTDKQLGYLYFFSWNGQVPHVIMIRSCTFCFFLFFWVLLSYPASCALRICAHHQSIAMAFCQQTHPFGQEAIQRVCLLLYVTRQAQPLRRCWGVGRHL